MNLTEWVAKEDLTIKEFANIFADAVIDNFGTHNYKCVVSIINEKLSETETTDKLSKQHDSKALSIADVSKQSELLFCGYCGSKLEPEVFTDVNTNKVCKNHLCSK